MKILQDTREQLPWSFGEYHTEIARLDSGDYTLEGLESVLCIERKKSPSEVAINIGSDSKRFNKELERMKKIEFSYLLLEFSLHDALRFPEGSDIPKSKLSQVRISGKFLVSTLNSYKNKYGIEVIYCGDRESAIEKAIEIFTLVEKIKNG